MEMRITERPSGKKADARKMAPELLEWCREFYQDPENERAFREWMDRKDERHDERACG